MEERIGQSGEASFIDGLLREYLEAKNALKLAQDKLNKLTEDVDAEAGNFPLEEGALKIKGELLKATVTRKKNASYEDKKLLSAMIQQHPDELAELFNIAVTESGKKVSVFIESGGTLAEELAALRKTKAAKPSIKVETQE